MNNMNIWQQLFEQTQLRWGEVLESTFVHIQLVFFSMIIATILAVTLGIVVTRVPWLKTIVLGGTGVLQDCTKFSVAWFYDSHFWYRCKYRYSCSISIFLTSYNAKHLYRHKRCG